MATSWALTRLKVKRRKPPSWVELFWLSLFILNCYLCAHRINDLIWPETTLTWWLAALLLPWNGLLAVVCWVQYKRFRDNRLK